MHMYTFPHNAEQCRTSCACDALFQLVQAQAVSEERMEAGHNQLNNDCTPVDNHNRRTSHVMLCIPETVHSQFISCCDSCRHVYSDELQQQDEPLRLAFPCLTFQWLMPGQSRRVNLQHLQHLRHRLPSLSCSSWHHCRCWSLNVLRAACN